VSSVTTTCPQCGLVYTGGEVFCPGDGARLAPRDDEPRASSAPKDPLIGSVVSGRYRIVRRIGEGGMGIVYEAEHVVIEKRVGLKVLREDFTSRSDVVERFRQEAKSASRIGHENIIDISDFGITDAGAHYFVMELLHGHDLAVELEQKGPLTPERAVRIVGTCARALGAAHAKGIVHRDMKPENIFLCARDDGDDFVKIVDFGIAKMNDLETGAPGQKLTKTGMIFGTPEYMSPEQASGKQLDHRVDVYALGIILFELLTGRVPFVGDTFMGILTAHVLEPVPPLRSVNPRCSASPELEAVVMKAVAKSPADRFQTMDELARELSHLPRLSAAPTSGGPSQPLPGTVTHYASQPPAAAGNAAPRLAVSESGFDERARVARHTGSKPATSWALAGAAVAGLVVVGGAFALLKKPAEPSEAPVVQQGAAPSVPSAPAVPTAIPPAPPASPAPAAPLVEAGTLPASGAASARVEVSVELEPSDAALSVDGVQVCRGVPCSFQAAPSSQVTLSASASGYKPSTLAVQVGASAQSLKLKLKRKASAPHSSDLMDVPQIRDAFGR
jgi:eukaryotic-like serine/threonine-protein kinase